MAYNRSDLLPLPRHVNHLPYVRYFLPCRVGNGNLVGDNVRGNNFDSDLFVQVRLSKLH